MPVNVEVGLDGYVDIKVGPRSALSLKSKVG
jgi:hypothetical protein